MTAFALAHPYLFTGCVAMVCATVFLSVKAVSASLEDTFTAWRRR